MGLINQAYRSNIGAVTVLKGTLDRYAEKLLAKRGGKTIKIMNFCGTHEWTTTHYGLRSLMPKNVELIAGPGCPVCVTPAFYVDVAIKLALQGVPVYTFGDAYGLPTVRKVMGARSLRDAKALGGDVRVVYSFYDAIRDAERLRDDAVFLGIGFETTAPSYALSFHKELVPKNLSFLSVVRLTPPAAEYALEKVGLVDAVVAPGHVSTVIGASPWGVLAEKFSIPVVVSGFEPIDLLLSIAMILRQLIKGESRVEIEYSRTVTFEGNLRAKKMMADTFQVHDAAWRGIGFIPDSGLKLSSSYEEFDATARFGLKEPTPGEWIYDLPPNCRCAEVTLGLIRPIECPLFKKGCVPERPYGPCMVSNEGACAIWARFGGGGLADEVARALGGG